MANRQLKIWRDDFMRYYGKTSLVMRIVICAGLSFAVAYYGLNGYLNPQQKEIKELTKKLQDMTVVGDSEFLMADLRNRQRKTSAQLESVRAANRELAERGGGITRGETGKTILALRSMIDGNKLKIISEDRMKPQDAAKRKPNSKVKDTRIKLALPESMDCECYTFIVLGEYGNLQNFLSEVFGAEQMFVLNNLKLSHSGEMITDGDLKQHKAIECRFEVHLPYQKEVKQ